jgi:hypothetical protein
MNLFLLGRVAAAFLVASLFFLRFSRESADRLFLFFAAPSRSRPSTAPCWRPLGRPTRSCRCRT